MQLITSSSQVVNVPPRISKEGFSKILEAVSSPALIEADQCYDAIVDQGVDPAYCLASFAVESAFGTIGICHDYQTKNPGNCRSSSIGIKESITDQEKGTFVKYLYWRQGFQDMAHRLVDKRFPYAQAGAKTIGQILPLWAPGADSNSPDSYVNTVVKLMQKWIGEGDNMTAIPTQVDIGYSCRVHWAYDVGPDRPLSNVNKFVVHDTEGNMGSDEPVLTNNDNNIASTHALIAPSGELVFMVRLDQTAWTPGNDVVAKQSINVEMSGFQSKGYTDAQYKSMAAFFRWCNSQGCVIPAEYIAKTGKPGILGHQDVPNPFKAGAFGGASGHTDPGPLFQWGKFVELCKGGLDHVTDNQPSKPAVRTFPTGKILGGGFLAFYDRLAAAGPNLELLTLGYPLTNEFDLPLGGQTKTVQLFERAGLVYEGANPSPWDVHTLTLSELAQALDVAKSRALLN